MKAGTVVRLVVSIRAWNGTLFPKGAVAVVLGVNWQGLRLESNKKRVRGVPLDAVEIIKEKP